MTPAMSAVTASTKPDDAAMAPEMARGSMATSVRKNRKNAVSSVAVMENPISEIPHTALVPELSFFISPSLKVVPQAQGDWQ